MMMRGPLATLVCHERPRPVAVSGRPAADRVSEAKKGGVGYYRTLGAIRARVRARRHRHSYKCI